mmetsp:Transcript_11265/g.37611  ORF Transcript_11265/g.37611 Transcript_11265/m.37611 type:complete len:241 (+) Transcript_11265:1141-1863(+)
MLGRVLGRRNGAVPRLVGDPTQPAAVAGGNRARLQRHRLLERRLERRPVCVGARVYVRGIRHHGFCGLGRHLCGDHGLGDRGCGLGRHVRGLGRGGDGLGRHVSDRGLWRGVRGIRRHVNSGLGRLFCRGRRRVLFCCGRRRIVLRRGVATEPVEERDERRNVGDFFAGPGDEFVARDARRVLGRRIKRLGSDRLHGGVARVVARRRDDLERAHRAQQQDGHLVLADLGAGVKVEDVVDD